MGSPTISSRTRPAHVYGIGLALLLALILAARLIALYANATDLFFDEAQYWSWGEDPAFGYYSKPPLIAWIIRLSTEACGLSEFCIRLPSSLLHTATALVIFATARRLYDPQVGFWSALVFATLPAVSLSAGIVSTDVPLLFCWAVALYAAAVCLQTKSFWPALLLGVAMGLGLNAKYAMGFFMICGAIYLIVTPEQRKVLKDVRLWIALAIAAAMIAPNLIWNWTNGFATFSHTADNAKWGGSLLHPQKALEFFGAQFGVFGPILFVSLGIITWRAWKQGLPEADRLLLVFSLPIILLITLQAFVSRAHANWAATAYVAATILVTVTMIRDVKWRWLTGSLVLHVGVAVLLGLATWQAGRFVLPGGADPLARTLGWRAIAKVTRAELLKAEKRGQPYAAVLTNDRAITAEFLYYLRNLRTPIYAWKPDTRPHDHYQQTRPFTAKSPTPVLLVSLRPNVAAILKSFSTVQSRGQVTVPAGLSKRRRLRLYELSGYRAP